MGREGDAIHTEATDKNDAEISQTPPSDDLTFGEAIAEQEDAQLDDAAPTE